MFQFELDEPVITKDLSTTADCGFKVSDKIVSEKWTGTVKYIGSVGSHPGIWLGIEWDNAERGKHNGTVDETQYFECSKENAGSFVRPAKVKKIRTALEALHHRYGEDEELINQLKTTDNVSVDRLRIKFSKLHTLNLSELEVVDLTNGQVADLCPSVQYLSIAENLVHEWKQVLDFVQSFKRLKSLDLSGNPLEKPTGFESTDFDFKNITEAILGKLNLQWDDILKLVSLWPNLENLLVPYNLVATITRDPKVLIQVKHIDFGRNKISDWSEVLNLGMLPNLEVLNLSGNAIKTIRFEQSEEKIAEFPSLKKLNLSENSIDDWRSVSELDKLPTLRDLRISMNPLLNVESRATNRQLIIARISALEKLEGVEINRQEIRDAELDYIKRYEKQWRLEGQSEKFKAEHPRFHALSQIYGMFGEEKKGNVALKSTLISLKIVSSKNPEKAEEKVFLPSMTVQKLKGMLRRTLKISSTAMTIEAISSKNADVRFELDNDFLELDQYGLETGDTLVVN